MDTKQNTNTPPLHTYTVVISEAADEGARHLLVGAIGPQAAASTGRSIAARHGYGVGPSLVRVYEGDIGGTTLGETAVYETVD